jgi:hypothetical protein
MVSFLNLITALTATIGVTTGQSISLYTDTACADFSASYSCSDVWNSCKDIGSIGSYIITESNTNCNCQQPCFFDLFQFGPSNCDGDDALAGGGCEASSDCYPIQDIQGTKDVAAERLTCQQAGGD